MTDFLTESAGETAVAVEIADGAWVEVTLETGPTVEVEIINGTKGDPGRDGKDGKDGKNGKDGEDGLPGPGVPAGGAAGQILRKHSGADYDGEWDDFDYADLSNKPQIAGTTLSGDKSLAELGIAAAADIPAVPSASTAAPAALGTASAGSAGAWSRGDHVHKMPSAADVGAMAAWELAWENASPESSFGAQTVAADLSAWDAVFIWFARSTSTLTDGRGEIVPMGCQCSHRTISNSSSSLRYYARNAAVSSSGVEFTACTYRQQGNSSASTENVSLVPLYIFGIKGVESA